MGLHLVLEELKLNVWFISQQCFANGDLLFSCLRKIYMYSLNYTRVCKKEGNTMKNSSEFNETYSKKYF